MPTAAALAAALTISSAPGPAHAAATGQAYVTNQSGGISVIDLATLEVTSEIDSYGREPRGLGVTGDGRLLISANREDGNISVIDRASGQLVRHIEIGANPEFVRIRGNMAFVSFEPSSEGKAPSAPGTPEAMAGADKKDDDTTPARIAIVDLVKGTVLSTIVGGLQTEGIEFAADGKHILVTNEAANTVTVHRLSDGIKVRTIDVKPFGDRPRGIKMAPDGKSYVATLEHGNAFAVIDAKTWKVVKSVPTEEYPYGAAFDRKGERLYIATAKSKVLQVFDARTYEPIKSVPTGARCWHFSFTPDDSQILIACGRSNEVVVIDVATLEPVKRIPDKKLPWGVVTFPKSMGSLDRPE
jgi:YVTN family beta-propeller protein